MDLAIVVLILLGIITVIDWKFKAIPSAFLTGLIFMTAMIHFYQFELGLISLAFGSLAFIYGWLLYEADFIGGLADVKVLTVIGLMIHSVPMFFVFVLATLLFGMTYKLTFRYLLKKNKYEEVPFIPPLYACYIALWIIGGVA
jgi:hypothetical protein